MTSSETSKPETGADAELPRIAQKGPYAANVVAGRRYLWCACGLSRKQPFCDGAHAGSGILPFFYVAQSTGEVRFCGCKRTVAKPICDGTHVILGAGSTP